MTVTITIDCDNATFEGLAGCEVARILEQLADKFRSNGSKINKLNRLPLRDITGASVIGKVRVLASVRDLIASGRLSRPLTEKAND